MSKSFDIANIIVDFHTKSKVEKAIAIFQEMRTGKYYYSSNIRKFVIEKYKEAIISLDPKEFGYVQSIILPEITNLIQDKINGKIAYSLLSQIIEYSCSIDTQIYNAYEKEILRLTNKSKSQFFHHFLTMTQTAKKIFNNIEYLEDFFIDKYLNPSPYFKVINYKYLMNFTTNVDCNRKKFLAYLVSKKPFRNEAIIKHFITQHKELEKVGLLI